MVQVVLFEFIIYNYLFYFRVLKIKIMIKQIVDFIYYTLSLYTLLEDVFIHKHGCYSNSIYMNFAELIY